MTDNTYGEIDAIDMMTDLFDIGAIKTVMYSEKYVPCVNGLVNEIETLIGKDTLDTIEVTRPNESLKYVDKNLECKDGSWFCQQWFETFMRSRPEKYNKIFKMDDYIRRIRMNISMLEELTGVKNILSLNYVRENMEEKGKKWFESFTERHPDKWQEMLCLPDNWRDIPERTEYSLQDGSRDSLPRGVPEKGRSL
jgi:hypothetical protein